MGPPGFEQTSTKHSSKLAWILSDRSKVSVTRRACNLGLEPFDDELAELLTFSITTDQIAHDGVKPCAAPGSASWPVHSVSLAPGPWEATR